MFPFVFKLSLLTLVASSPTKYKDKIVGGDEIDIKEAPYQVAVYNKGSFHCGGSIVDHDVIITAAHCLELVVSPTASDFSIRAGSSNMNEGGQLVQASSIIPHPNYAVSYLDYDVGIIRLVKPLVYSDVIKPIQMADVRDEIPDGADTTLTGWGRTIQGGNCSTILRRVVIQKVNDVECSKIYKYMTNPRSLCAGMPKGGKGHCQGDSGGPLVYNSKLVGIVSWGRGCGKPGYPSVFTKVAAVRNWIDENVKLKDLKD